MGKEAKGPEKKPRSIIPGVENKVVIGFALAYLVPTIVEGINNNRRRRDAEQRSAMFIDTVDQIVANAQTTTLTESMIQRSDPQQFRALSDFSKNFRSEISQNKVNIAELLSYSWGVSTLEALGKDPQLNQTIETITQNMSNIPSEDYSEESDNGTSTSLFSILRRYAGDCSESILTFQELPQTAVSIVKSQYKLTQDELNYISDPSARHNLIKSDNIFNNAVRVAAHFLPGLNQILSLNPLSPQNIEGSRRLVGAARATESALSQLISSPTISRIIRNENKNNLNIHDRQTIQQVVFKNLSNEQMQYLQNNPDKLNLIIVATFAKLFPSEAPDSLELIGTIDALQHDNNIFKLVDNKE
jgi:type II secretory pathway pseudopilin PulG